jgi:hypothetical protein
MNTIDPERGLALTLEEVREVAKRLARCGHVLFFVDAGLAHVTRRLRPQLRQGVSGYSHKFRR